ncbi:DEAD/DEAH box helicase [Lachnobacterium bovis]|uniref:DEAD/DEAH box helicase n=1 Tax=Lachnobacterium bovis TaxID=140626 RepID=A0A1H9U6P4_9FIRM|nr:DEAD/DEAH box helicase [Lachnobacterium bovis]SES04898.1 DEAD/DEAH box helicase [Lachnobacterium bovis]
MTSINRFELLCEINDASLNNDSQSIIKRLNILFSNGTYKEFLDLIFAAISVFQLYGFLAYLDEDEKEVFFNTDIWRSSSYKGIVLDYYNRGQLSVVKELNNNSKLLLSAPTSFGKTSLILEYILENKKKLHSIIFILPTNSLIEELYIKLLAYNKKHDLNYIVTNQPSKLQGRNIFLLTPERFLMMYQIEKQALFQADLIVMDEMYKIRTEDKSSGDFLNDRSLRFRKVADIAAKCENKVFYLSPFTYNDTESMLTFMDKNNICKINRRMEYVNKRIISPSSLGFLGRKKSEKTVSLLKELENEKNIVYVSARDLATDIIKIYDEQGDGAELSGRLKAFYLHLKNNYVIDEYEWDVARAVRNGVGIYIAPMPRYIKREIISLYESDELSTIIATTAFTEGVNCNAKNMILTSAYTGKNIPLTQIDLLNAIGRVGRFAKESIGNIYCIDNETYEKAVEFNNADSCYLENDNYRQLDKPRSDYELDMMDNSFLKTDEVRRKKTLAEYQSSLGLSNADLNISLNVSKRWKLVLYTYFKAILTPSEIQVRKERMRVILDNQEGQFIDALNFFFSDLRIAFERGGIDNRELFPNKNGEIPAFDKSGQFVWGRLYGNYVLGDVKKSIQHNIKYIVGRFNTIVNESGKSYRRKRDVKALFEEEGCTWILQYFTKNLEPNFSKFYSEYFKFVSSIMQYKIPFYLTFYLAIFNLYLEKECTEFFDESDMKEKDIMLLFEEGALAIDYKELVDFGVPMITINKIKKSNIELSQLKKVYMDMKELDSYEKIMLNDYYLLNPIG